MTYTSNLSAVEALFREAQDAGLLAAVQVPMNETKRRLRGGYTDGRWVTGATLNAVTRGEPEDGPEGRQIRYGTNLLYNLYWELGFHQRLIVWMDQATGQWYSRPGPTRFVRKEIWLPVFRETAEAQRDAFARGFAQVWGGAAGHGPAPLSEAADD